MPGTLALGNSNYTSTQLLQILDTPTSTPGPGANALLILSKQLIATLLNGLNGASTAPVTATIAEAHSLIGDLVIPPIGAGDVNPASPLGQDMVAAGATLDQYNNGNLGVPHCD